jgi:hypothetical protein
MMSSDEVWSDEEWQKLEELFDGFGSDKWWAAEEMYSLLEKLRLA